MAKRDSYFLSLSYFLFFAALGIFLPYFNLYCYHLNFSAKQIGFLSAATALARMVSPIFWAYWADHVWKRKKISVLTSLASAIVFFFCLFITNFKTMLAGIFLYGFFRTAIVPLLEASTWETIDTSGGEYGKIRLWGSVGFILSSLASGWLLDRLPLAFALYGIAVLTFALFFVSLSLPQDLPQKTEHRKENHFFAFLMKPSMAIFILVCVLMQISHGTYYGFYTIYMEQLGFSRTLVGSSWALSVICEIILMARYQRWFHKTGPALIMIISCFVAAWRWWVMSYTQSLAFILLAQCAHAFTYAAFHVASLTYLNQVTPLNLRNSGQGFLNGISYGFGGMIGLGISGTFYESWGAQELFRISGFFSFWAGGFAILHAFIPFKPKTLPADQR